MSIKMYKTAALAMAILAAGATQASAQTISLFEWAFNVDGTTNYMDTSAAQGGSIPDTVLDDSGFDYGTGLGELTFSFSGAGAHNLAAYFDHELEGVNTPFFENTGGSSVALPAVQQSWEIDDPDWDFQFGADLYGHVVASDPAASALDGTMDPALYGYDHVGDGNDNPATGDIAMAMGWNFSLANGETALITLSVAEQLSRSYSGFYLWQHDPLEGGTIYLLGDLDINPVPEPATMLLLGTGLAGLAGLRRKNKA